MFEGVQFGEVRVDKLATRRQYGTIRSDDLGAGFLEKEEGVT